MTVKETLIGLAMLMLISVALGGWYIQALVRAWSCYDPSYWACALAAVPFVLCGGPVLLLIWNVWCRTL